VARTAALCAGAVVLLAWCWLRLEHPHAGGWTALWLILLAVAPALLPRLRWRLAALAGAAVLAGHAAFDVWITHPLRLGSRFWGGFLEFYDVRLPFAAANHARMEGVLLVALFVSCAALALAVAARRPVTAAAVLLVGAGWPATLLTGPDDLWRGVALLALLLLLVVGLGGRLHPRRLGVGVGVGIAVVLASFGVAHSSAVASGQVLHWEGWDFYTKPQKPVGVEYVWNSDYTGLKFPKKITTVLRIKAPPRRTYWRATTLDEFDNGNWYEDAVETFPTRVGDRYELREDVELPPAALKRSRWVRQEVTVGALRDRHLIGASVPVAYQSAGHFAEYAAGGVAFLQGDPLSPGDEYTVWSYQPQPTPRQLARLQARYPALVKTIDLRVAPHVTAPVFGRPGREEQVAEIFRNSYVARQYEGVYARARRVIGEPRTPYGAALELEAWFRAGGFRYDENPPQVAGVAPLVAFVLQTHRGYCQHFAGAMALMLRYLGIPARVAAGFTSGTYDEKKGDWTVTDHDAHTWVEAWFPRYGWLPFDPTPGRGELEGPYTASSPRFDLTDGLYAVASQLKKRKGSFDPFDLRKLGNGRKAQVGAAAKENRGRMRGGSDGSGIGALLKLLTLVAAGLALAVALVKSLLRKRRYLTRDPRRLAGACVQELTDYLADQGANAPPGTTLRDLGRLVETEIGVSAAAFVESAATARFGPAEGAVAAARETRRELRALRRRLRAALSKSERALGLVSLRSLGLTG
jgi:transglutaminase-like putative cysteine protease